MILSIFSIFLLYAIYKFVWKPWKRQKNYAASFRAKGYRVFEAPFRPYGMSLFKFYDFSPDTKDALENVKKHYPNYDVAILNIFNSIFIDILHPDLAQEFLSSEKLPFYKKSDLEKGAIIRVGSGLVFSEGTEWKAKRKVLTQVFNFEFIKSLSPKIALASDKVLDEIEKKYEGKEMEFDIHEYSTNFTGMVIF